MIFAFFQLNYNPIKATVISIFGSYYTTHASLNRKYDASDGLPVINQYKGNIIFLPGVIVIDFVDSKTKNFKKNLTKYS